MKCWSKLFIAAGCFCSFPAYGQMTDGSGLKFSAAVDLQGEYALSKETTAADEFVMREAEFMFYGPVDHSFDAVLSFAAHREGGAAFAEVHEAYLSSNKLVPRLRLKVGQFFLGVGRLNRWHRHDWPFISAPVVHETFFDAEAVADKGAEAGMLLPLPFYLDATVGYTEGYTFGHSHDGGEKPKKPTVYGHLASFSTLPSDYGLLYGLSYLTRTDAAGLATELLGLNGTLKKREGKVIRVLVETEVWHRQQKPEEADAERSLGFYVFPQYGFDNGILLGVLYDSLSVLTLEDARGKSIANKQESWTPTLTYQHSEFTRFRLAYKSYKHSVAGSKVKEGETAELQLTYILGAHPAHEF